MPIGVNVFIILCLGFFTFSLHRRNVRIQTFLDHLKSADAYSPDAAQLPPTEVTLRPSELQGLIDSQYIHVRSDGRIYFAEGAVHSKEREQRVRTIITAAFLVLIPLALLWLV